jgi:hypothetical protein
MRPINKKSVILSAELSTKDDEYNKQVTKTLHGFLNKNKIPFKELVGHYKGHNESSVLIELSDKFNLRQANDLSQWYDQECLMILDEDRNAIIYNETDYGLTQVPLGKLKAITPKQAQKLDAWSYCPLNDQYYGVL